MNTVSETAPAVAAPAQLNKDTYKGRALEMLGELQQTYGKGSRFVPEAQKAIAEVK